MVLPHRIFVTLSIYCLHVTTNGAKPQQYSLSAGRIGVSFSNDANLEIFLDGAPLLVSRDAAIRCNGRWHSVSNNTLTPLSVSRRPLLDPVHGRGDSISIDWKTSGGDLTLNTSVTVFEETNSVVFSQFLPQGCPDASPASPDPDGVITAWPAFDIADSPALARRFVTWGPFSEFGAKVWRVMTWRQINLRYKIPI